MSDQPYHKRKGTVQYGTADELGLATNDVLLAIMRRQESNDIGIVLHEDTPVTDPEKIAYFLYCAIVEMSAQAGMRMPGNSAENTAKAGRDIIAHLNMLSFTDPGKGVPGHSGI